MAHFSEYQAFQYSRIFERFASASGELTIDDLALALPLFGPERDYDDVASLFQRHDSRQAGSLNFDDFLSVLSELLRESDKVNKEHVSALNHLCEKLGRSVDGITREDLGAILKAGAHGLTDVEVDDILNDLFPSTQETLTGSQVVQQSNEKSKLAWVPKKDPPVLLEDTLTRVITIHLFSARGLASLAKPKQLRRGDKTISYESLNPYVSVSCFGVTKDSTVLINQLNPEWDQELTLTITLPSNKFSTLQEICRNEYLTFTLYDHDMSGVSPQQLWLGSAMLPLSCVLRAVRAPILHVLNLRSPESLSVAASTSIYSVLESTPVRLEVSVKVNEGEISEHIQIPSIMWGSVLKEKLVTDLNELAATTAGVQTVGVDMPKEMPFWEQMLDYTSFGSFYTTFFSGLHSEFPRRYFQVIGMNEVQKFYPLPCFVTPLYSNLSTMKDIARCVARIPGRFPSIPFRPPAKSSNHISHPFLTLFNGYGGKIDHSILLCDLFLGMGIDAFVALGRLTGTHADGTRHAWVITRHSIGEEVTETKNLTRGSRQSSYNLYAVSQANLDDGDSPGGTEKEYQVTLWETSTGRSYAVRDENCPFLRVDTLFNGKNVYCNVQPSNLVTQVKWDINVGDYWRKFITPRARQQFLPNVPLCYPRYPLPEGVDPKLPEDTVAFVRGLVSAIQQYRRDTLFLPVTQFYGPICKILQDSIPFHEERLMGGPEEQRSSDKAITSSLEQVNSALPPRSYWHGRCFHFDSSNISSLIMQLGFTGMLDCSVPNVLYAIAGDFFLYPLGTKSVWVYVGYVVDIAAET